MELAARYLMSFPHLRWVTLSTKSCQWCDSYHASAKKNWTTLCIAQYARPFEYDDSSCVIPRCRLYEVHDEHASEVLSRSQSKAWSFLSASQTESAIPDDTSCEPLHASAWNISFLPTEPFPVIDGTESDQKLKWIPELLLRSRVVCSEKSRVKFGIELFTDKLVLP
jgi:hypothetical protein